MIFNVGTRGGESIPIGLGLGVASGDYASLRRCAGLADSAGFAFVSVGDNPSAMKDTYVSLTVLADATATCWIGTAVTNPLHRDPLVVASAISSVESLAPGRVFLGIATGRAREPATLADLREHVAVLRSLWSDGEAPYRGEVLHLGWDARPVPVMVCASGPKGLRLAGEIADAIIIESGVSTESIEQARGWIAEGAEISNRDPAQIELWWYMKTSIAETKEEAVSYALAPIAASCGFVLGRDPVTQAVPRRFHDMCRQIREGYNKSSHLRTESDDPNRRLLEPGPFRDYLFERFALVGAPADWVERIAQLRERGVTNIFCAAVVPDIEYFVTTVGNEVLPEVSRRGR